jgi:flagellar hook-associated protein 3 FlgL
LRLDPNYINSLAASVDQSNSSIATLTGELSSGLSVSSLQDNPTAVAQSTLLNSAISADDTYVQTASSEQSRLQVADSTLGEVVTQLTSAISTAVEGNDGSLNAANLASISQKLSGIRDQVLSLANTSYQGQYLFSGSQGSVQPFTLDASTTPATTTYNGDTNIQSIDTPNGQTIQTNLPGSAVFGGASGAFTALNQLIADYSSGASSATLTTDTSALTTALGQVSDQRSVLDNALSTVESTSTYAQTQAADLTVQQGSLVSADPAMVATQLSSAETQQQALLSAVSALQKNNNLFDYLQ